MKLILSGIISLVSLQAASQLASEKPVSSIYSRNPEKKLSHKPATKQTSQLPSNAEFPKRVTASNAKRSLVKSRKSMEQELPGNASSIVPVFKRPKKNL